MTKTTHSRVAQALRRFANRLEQDIENRYVLPSDPIKHATHIDREAECEIRVTHLTKEELD